MILRGGIPRSITGLPRRLDSKILSLRVLSGTRPVTRASLPFPVLVPVSTSLPQSDDDESHRKTLVS